MLNKIPTNVIMGYLGVGKTTTIKNLLKTKAQNENWAVIVNEFGTVSIDNFTIENSEASNIIIKDIQGGCICCTAAGYFDQALQQLSEIKNIDRILIEPTGIGYLTGLEESLKNNPLIDIQSNICLVDPKQLKIPGINKIKLFTAQLTFADIIIANKTDLASKEEMNFFWDWIEKQTAKKIYVGTMVNGELSPGVLKLANKKKEKLNSESKLTDFHIHTGNTTSEKEIIEQAVADKKSPLKFSNKLDKLKCDGWIFSKDDVFDKFKLIELLNQIKNTERFKGIFQTSEAWILINGTNRITSIENIKKQNDSRFEIIHHIKKGFSTSIESELIKCIV